MSFLATCMKKFILIERELLDIFEIWFLAHFFSTLEEMVMNEFTLNLPSKKHYNSRTATWNSFLYAE